MKRRMLLWTMVLGAMLIIAGLTRPAESESSDPSADVQQAEGAQTIDDGAISEPTLEIAEGDIIPEPPLADPDARGLDGRTREERFLYQGVLQPEEAEIEDTEVLDDGAMTIAPNRIPVPRGPVEAPTGFDNLTNGFDAQGPDFDSLNAANVVALRSFNDNRFLFETVENVADGLGPTYNAQSCRECHQNVVTGGASQVTELRIVRTANGEFFESLSGSLIQSRATHPNIVEHGTDNNIAAFRLSTNTLGAGFIECISNSALLSIWIRQPAEMRGTLVLVPVLEAGGQVRIGRFGWKCQHASLQSFAADAYLNEMGITSPLFPEENNSDGRFVGFGSGFDPLPEVEDDGEDVRAFANFMRSTKAPSRRLVRRKPFLPDPVYIGREIFIGIGCATCHTPDITTAPPGTPINGGAFTVPRALGNKIIHPYSDFLLHDIGTGDGIPVLPLPEYAATANQMRTAPLWGLRTRNRLMHDGMSLSLDHAIRRHAGQAAAVTSRYDALDDAQKYFLKVFLDSL